MFTFRVKTSVLNEIRTRAKRASKTVTDYLIYSALDKKIIIIESLSETRKELSRIGNNLNQLTTLCNMGRISAVNLVETRNILSDAKRVLIDIDKQIRRG